jgi:hypothetical protein
MKKGIILVLIIFTISVISGYSNGQTIVKEKRDLKEFTKVNFGVSGTLYISIGPGFKIDLEGEKDVLDDIVTEVKGGSLLIKKDNWRLNINEKVTIYITMPEITGLAVSGSGKAEIRDAVKSENLNLNVSGSGRILTSNVTSANLNCVISGSGDINIGGNGSTTNADVVISGSGSFKGETCKLQSAKIVISGSGSCLCNVTESLKSNISGSGNITYIGDLRIDARVSGSGRVRSK